MNIKFNFNNKDYDLTKKHYHEKTMFGAYIFAESIMIDYIKKIFLDYYTKVEYNNIIGSTHTYLTFGEYEV